jgi:hypothetical protein
MKQRSKFNFYVVTAKCGHVGRSRYCLKPFYVAAPDGRSAARIVRCTGRVKHHHKDAIRDVAEISAAEYLAGRRANGRDPYFCSSSVQEQRMNFDRIAGCVFEEERPAGRVDGAGRKKRLSLRHRVERKEDKYGRLG